MAVIRASAYLTAGSTDGPLTMPQWDRQEKSSNLNFLIQKDVGMLIINLHNPVQKFFFFEPSISSVMFYCRHYDIFQQARDCLILCSF